MVKYINTSALATRQKRAGVISFQLPINFYNYIWPNFKWMAQNIRHNFVNSPI